MSTVLVTGATDGLGKSVARSLVAEGHIDTLERGTAVTVALATGPEVEGVTGRFYDREAAVEPDAQASDPEAQRRLWELSVKLTGAPTENV